jgi:hypothetical protein
MPTGQYLRPFWNRVKKDGPVPKHNPTLGPCWIWLGTKNQYGYGRITKNGKFLLVHRVLYEQYVGPISKQLDHLCRNRSCVRPSHLQDATHQENCLRGRTPNILTHVERRCRRGHTEFYSIRNGKGIRCRICKLETNRRYRENRKKKSRS